jgi:replication factor C large subunit
VNRARHHRYGGYTRYSSPTYWQKLGRTRSGRAVRDSLSAKIGKHCHTSKREARAFYIPLLRTVFRDEDYAVGLSARLKLDEDEIAFLMDAEKSSKKVEKIYEASRGLIEKEAEHEIDVFGRFSAPLKEGPVSEPVPEAQSPKAPRKKRKVARDGGGVVEDVKEVPEKAEEPPAVDPNRQRTLFDF